MIDMLMIVAGLVLLFFGGEGLLKGSVALARNFGLSNLLVSAVIVGFGTSMPEMTVSVGAALSGSPEIAIGNIIGSNIANILLIVGFGALLYPLLVDKIAVRRDTVMMIIAGLVFCGLSLTGELSFIEGFIMFAVLVGYIIWSYFEDKKASAATPDHIQEDIEGVVPLSSLKAALYSIVGLGLLIGGASLLVEGAVSLARDFGISEVVIGLTLVAVGTSLPELATAIVASLKKHTDVIIGNILGSNIFNILSILGVTAMIETIPVPAQMMDFDIWFMMGISALLGVLLWRGVTFGRFLGVIMLLVYSGYIGFLYLAM